MTAIPPIGMSSIQSVPSLGSATSLNSAAGPKPSGQFSNLIEKAVGSVNQQMQAANQSVQDLADGKSDDMQGVVVSMAKADLSFRFILEIRNKLMEAYQEIMRMQV